MDIKNLKEVVRLTANQYQVLSTEGSLIVGGETLVYDPNTTLYVTTTTPIASSSKVGGIKSSSDLLKIRVNIDGVSDVNGLASYITSIVTAIGGTDPEGTVHYGTINTTIDNLDTRLSNLENVIVTDGDGAKYLANDGTYKTIDLSNYATFNDLKQKQGIDLVFNDVAVSANDWVADNTYADYGYKASVNLNGVDSTMVPFVTFNVNESTSGNYAGVADSYLGGIYIWSKTNTAITIPTIVMSKTLNFSYTLEENSAGGYTLTIMNADYTLEENAAGGYTMIVGD